jgi:hypothetical protein
MNTFQFKFGCLFLFFGFVLLLFRIKLYKYFYADDEKNPFDEPRVYIGIIMFFLGGLWLIFY